MENTDLDNQELQNQKKEFEQLEQLYPKNHSTIKVSTAKLLLQTLDFFKENYAIILKLFLLTAIFDSLFYTINQRFFSDISRAISDNAYPLLLSLPTSHLTSYVLVKILHFAIAFCLYFSAIFAFDRNIWLSEAVGFMTRKVVPTFLSSLLYLFIILTALFGVTVSVIILSFSDNLFSYTLKYSIIIFFLIFVLFCLLRSSLIYFTTIIEEKYYLQSVARSFVYTKGNSLNIASKAFAALLIASLFSIAFSALTNLLLALPIRMATNLDSSPYFKYIANFISSQFCLIFGYIMYQYYKIELPEESFFTRNYRMLVGAIILSSIAIFLLGGLAFRGKARTLTINAQGFYSNVQKILKDVDSARNLME